MRFILDYIDNCNLPTPPPGTLDHSFPSLFSSFQNTYCLPTFNLLVDDLLFISALELPQGGTFVFFLHRAIFELNIYMLDKRFKGNIDYKIPSYRNAMNYKHLTKTRAKKEGNSKCIKDIILISYLGQRNRKS